VRKKRVLETEKIIIILIVKKRREMIKKKIGQKRIKRKNIEMINLPYKKFIRILDDKNVLNFYQIK